MFHSALIASVHLKNWTASTQVIVSVLKVLSIDQHNENQIFSKILRMKILRLKMSTE